MHYFSPSTRGFYTVEANSGFIPEDAVEIEAPLYYDMMAGQAVGKQITVGKGGLPVLTDPAPPTDDELIAKCKQDARALLSATDYTQAADVAASLKNAADFTAYREAVRAIFRKPVPAPKWPEAPQPDWG